MTNNNVVDVDEVGLVHVPKKQEEANKGNVPMEAGKNQLDSIYDHYQKKIYLFDRSGSMSGGMVPEDEIKMYLWAPDTLDKFRKMIADDLEAQVIMGAMTADEAEALARKIKNDEDLKLFIVERQLHQGYDNNYHSLEPPRDPSYAKVTERKVEAVRGAMKRFVEKRFKQYPDAQVGMVGFGSRSNWMCYPGAPQPEVLTAVEALDASFGGTNIVDPIKMALTEFKKRPSHVGSHHIVMVTDAEAYMEVQQAAHFLHQMKELNVMFDLIYVKGQVSTYGFKVNQKDEPEDPNSVLALLKKMCRETGGEYVEVSKSSDFEIKFFQASERKALPPAPQEVK